MLSIIFVSNIDIIFICLYSLCYLIRQKHWIEAHENGKNMFKLLVVLTRTNFTGFLVDKNCFVFLYVKFECQVNKF